MRDVNLKEKAMIPALVAKVASGVVLVVEKSKNVDGKKALLIAVPSGMAVGAIVAVIF
ncbi:hypothetical protein KAR63_08310 [Weissella uvarum]|uniref:hypothetical protein n=1 Tax=Weissella uvarum TaxID=1479233 RepID=UPI001960ACF3|nr:hypothetical protein [Weissella uvarum]MCM0596174.1 hypothetical protein [Weissella uvarum]